LWCDAPALLPAGDQDEVELQFQQVAGSIAGASHHKL